MGPFSFGIPGGFHEVLGTAGRDLLNYEPGAMNMSAKSLFGAQCGEEGFGTYASNVNPHPPARGKAQGWFYGGLFWTGFCLIFAILVSDHLFWFEAGSDWFLGALAPPRTNLNRFPTKTKTTETKSNQSKTKLCPKQTP